MLDDDEGERKADGDPKSDGDESAASALSIVTADRKNREDAAPNSTIERDMVDRVLYNRGAAIPAQHQAIIFVRFVEEQWDPREAAPVYSQSYQLSAV